jgi:hypothetical protein
MDLISGVHREGLIQVTTTNPSPGVNYSPHMVNNDMKVLVKEERQPYAIPAIVPLLSSSGGKRQPLYFLFFDLHICLS